jgi:Zn-dependent peptidase ImmA (M78 family)
MSKTYLKILLAIKRLIVSYVNPNVMRWARERNGLSIEALATKIKRDPSEISAWEAGVGSPSYGVLEELAYRHFKIPIAVFFFPNPPDIEDPIKKFRRLPDYELSRFSADTLQKIRLGQAYQDSLNELIGGAELPRRIFLDLKPNGVTPLYLAKKARAYLGITLEQQFSFNGCESAFKAWRHAIEQCGVFSFKDSFKDRFVSGFSLVHERFPIIFVNNSNAFARQIFTIIHEFGHILYGVHGVTDVDDTYVQFMRSGDKRIEIECNKFASELLVPPDAFEGDKSNILDSGLTVISEIADKYCVSREVILRKLLDSGAVTDEFYRKKAKEWTREYLRSKATGGGGNYYLTRLSYLGEGFTRLAFENYHSGRLNEIQLANHLNINAKNIGKLETYVRW